MIIRIFVWIFVAIFVTEYYSMYSYSFITVVRILFANIRIVSIRIKKCHSPELRLENSGLVREQRRYQEIFLRYPAKSYRVKSYVSKSKICTFSNKSSGFEQKNVHPFENSKNFNQKNCPDPKTACPI